MNQKKILIVEDDTDLAKMIANYLSRENYDALICGQGDKAINFVKQYRPDMILLDLMLPEMDGLEILKQIRAFSVLPVIIISAKETELDRVLGLKIGADDYITKSFSIKELVARVEALFRRYDYAASPSASNDIIAFDDIIIDRSSRNVTKDGLVVNLTMKEFDLLVFLAQSPNQAFRKEQLYDNVWGIHEYGDINTVTIHVQKIREKLGNSSYITTLRGVGYRFDGEML
ncbi:response regulator transcription factor [Oceanobacillus jeddahense]|uniref:Response regulator transcription factor n=1 Tax=Oceanobacillus jeddahense TaxID=1462527 RepID=A0ABY5JLQ4_9BACI|nr:response regulator transcription factor [Oceanobacillus jeddahense]UUI01230.1 response regulator transcription factor [Oceanobacillus jeddahense]